jgi:hypothetical protein
VRRPSQTEIAFLLQIGVVLAIPVYLIPLFFDFSSSWEELSRITDPLGTVDAVIARTNCGATCDFGYLFYAVPRGQAADGQPILADLYHVADRDDSAAITVRWQAPDSLVVEYEAKRAELLLSRIQVGGRTVHVLLVPR